VLRPISATMLAGAALLLLLGLKPFLTRGGDWRERFGLGAAEG
jgi:hypothetical protein